MGRCRIDPDLDVQMARIADAAIRWSVVHWLAASLVMSAWTLWFGLVLARTTQAEGRHALVAW